MECIHCHKEISSGEVACRECYIAVRARIFDLGIRSGKKRLIEDLIELFNLDSRYERRDE